MYNGKWHFNLDCGLDPYGNWDEEGCGFKQADILLTKKEKRKKRFWTLPDEPLKPPSSWGYEPLPFDVNDNDFGALSQVIIQFEKDFKNNLK